MENKFVLYNTYLTDIVPLGCSLQIVKSADDREYYSRTYTKGEITFQDKIIQAECITFVAGNVQISSISGENAQELYDQICDRHRRRWFPIGLRTLIVYLFCIWAIPIGLVNFNQLIHFRLGAFSIGFIVLFILRLIYVDARNHIR